MVEKSLSNLRKPRKTNVEFRFLKKFFLNNVVLVKEERIKKSRKAL